MHIDSKSTIGKMPLFAIGIVALGLAACDSKPTEQASRDAAQIVDSVPSPAAGKEGDGARMDGKDVDRVGAAPPAQSVDDVALNIKVQDALKSNFTLKGLPILVQTTDGVVTLSGSANTPANREQAEQVAMNVAGVKSVQNKLRVGDT